MGNHQIRWTSGQFSASSAFTVIPGIKVTPASVVRGQTVDVSLRGFAAREVVRIRWNKGSSWVEVARVTTSNTGSANVNVAVPSFASFGSRFGPWRRYVWPRANERGDCQRRDEEREEVDPDSDPEQDP